ncbi:hypothetical protein K443DRAFT_134120 [Laccaria amethystina LaAM-08-1]|uniref:Unplaced genomic scaffold K443scaffold_184, whole genome shotgun sequence n=1 Tax=Laccaria amethystina LaAM-08-1 TaxID=1095629 RepID=A0A0C9WKM4_9AGAR|nr:hypothetical protein K443DRAFT_134120 [Laccaria amethystina LaAM-08-1]
MADAYSINATHMLCSGIPTLYPSSDPDMDPEGHFFVTYFSQPLRIDKSIITNAHFDLAKWYQAQCYPKVQFDAENVDVDLSTLFNKSSGPSSELIEELILTAESNNYSPELHADDDVDYSDMPDLQSVTDSDWDEEIAAAQSDWDEHTYTPIGEIHGELVAQNLEICAPYPGDVPSSRALGPIKTARGRPG